MKRVCYILVVLTILISVVTPVEAQETEEFLLSQMSEEECLAFLEKAGVELPPGDVEWGAFAKKIIAQVESDPDCVFTFGYTHYHFFAEEIRKVVNEHYGIEQVKGIEIQSSRYALQDSTVVGIWDNVFLEYNCYGYAIGLMEWLNPGSLSGSTMNPETDSINLLTSYVRDDLLALGYNNVIIRTFCPELNTIHIHRKLICVRMDTDGNAQGRDYHFMMYSSNNWYHKPGGTNPLRYRFTPSTSRDWTNECSIQNVAFGPDRTYEGTIYFITYDMPHNYEYVTVNMENGGYGHVMECEGCGMRTGTIQPCVYRPTGYTCLTCGWDRRLPVVAWSVFANSEPTDFEE